MERGESRLEPRVHQVSPDNTFNFPFQIECRLPNSAGTIYQNKKIDKKEERERQRERNKPINLNIR